MQKIPLHDGSFAIVDDQDFAELSRYKWHLSSGYPTRSVRKGSVTEHTRMHAAIIGHAPPGLVTDHKNTNKRDNRRGNLRFCSSSLNNRNRRNSKHGVYWHKKAAKWAIVLSIGEKHLYFGLFETEEEARSVAALLKGSLMYYELTKGG